QSALSPAGPQAASIHLLWSWMLWVSIVVFVVVVVFVCATVVRGRRRGAAGGRPATSERALTRGVSVAVALTVVTLVGLLVGSVWTGRTVASLHASSAVSVAVTGHQWWWEIEYEDAVPERRARTANEIHLPIDRPVVLK